MTSNEIISTYESLSKLTGSMLNAASEGDWDNLAELEQRCQVHVGSLMKTTPVLLNENEQSTKIAIIRTILQNQWNKKKPIHPSLMGIHEGTPSRNVLCVQQSCFASFPWNFGALLVYVEKFLDSGGQQKLTPAPSKLTLHQPSLAPNSQIFPPS